MYLKHYGVKGQKKGQRRYQNKDGSLTALGHQRYENIRKELQKTYPGWDELETMDDKHLSMVYDGLIKRHNKMNTKIAEARPELIDDIEIMSYEEKTSIYKEIKEEEKAKEALQNGDKMNNEEIKHSIDNGLSIVYAILGEEDHLEHYNHNHDALGRFATTTGGAKYEKKLDKLQSKIDKNNASIEGYKKKINPKKQLKADKLRAKSGKYAKAEAKYQKKTLKGKEVSASVQKKHDKYANLNAKADLKDAKNVKWNSKISELEIKNQKAQMKIDKVLKKMTNAADKAGMLEKPFKPTMSEAQTNKELKKWESFVDSYLDKNGVPKKSIVSEAASKTYLEAVTEYGYPGTKSDYINDHLYNDFDQGTGGSFDYYSRKKLNKSGHDVLDWYASIYEHKDYYEKSKLKTPQERDLYDLKLKREFDDRYRSAKGWY